LCPTSLPHFPSAKDADVAALAREDVLCGQVQTLRAFDRFSRNGSCHVREQVDLSIGLMGYLPAEIWATH
jgi:hypothetical protein